MFKLHIEVLYSVCITGDKSNIFEKNIMMSGQFCGSNVVLQHTHFLRDNY